MRKHLLIASALMGTAALGAGLALAQDAPPPHERGERGPGGPRGGHPPLELLDTDGDGSVTTAEIEAHQASVFAEADANGDGTLTADEMTSFHEAKRQKAKEERQARGQKRMMEKLDTNQDGVISAEEFSTGPRGVFKRLDTDEDGVITEAERDAAKERMKDHRGKRGERRGRD